MDDLRRCCRELVEIFAVERVDEVDLVTLEPQHFHVTIGLNVEADGIEVGQFVTLVIRFPIIRIPLEQDCRSWLVVGHHEGPEHRHLLLRRMRRQNRHLIELSIKPGNGSGEGDGDLRRRDHLYFHISRAGAERVPGR